MKSLKDFNQKGQALVIIAFAILGLIAFLGLAVDVGRTFIAYGNLRKAADAGALAAAGQYREGSSIAQLEAAARDVMNLNGVTPTHLSVEVCDYSVAPENQDPVLCTYPKRKLVRINTTATIDMTFLRVLGMHEFAISSSAVGEAASMDVVLVLDISDSMTYDAATNDPMIDPAACNDTVTFDGSEDAGEYPQFPNGFPGECHPFEEVKRAASEFVLRILDKDPILEEDRIAIVTFANGWSSDPDLGTEYRTSGWTSNQGTALNIIRDMKVFEPGTCHDPIGSENIDTYWGPCRNYDADGNYLFPFRCYSCDDYGDYSALATTNVGGGLLKAGNMFAEETREESLWVVVVLTDGSANATDLAADDDLFDPSTYPLGYCPDDGTIPPACQDEDISTRHSSTNLNYDADDYARDMADFIGCYPEDPAAACGGQTGQGAVIFSIGLGPAVLNNINEATGQPYGAALLRYIASVGYDGDPANDPCAGLDANEDEWKEWCGNYYYSPTGGQLVGVFEDIASRIFTRLTR